MSYKQIFENTRLGMRLTKIWLIIVGGGLLIKTMEQTTLKIMSMLLNVME